MVTGFLLGSLPFSLFALGEERVSSALAGIGNSTTPIATVLFSLLLLPVDKIGARKLVGVLIGFVGVLVIMQPWQSQGPGSSGLRHDGRGHGLPVRLWIVGPENITGQAHPGRDLRSLNFDLVQGLAYWLWQFTPGLVKHLRSAAGHDRLTIRLDLPAHNS